VNTEALLSLIADLYAQIRGLADENARLKAEAAEDS